MQALRLTEFGREPRLEEVPEPSPGLGEVVIEVGGAGACHSDLHLLYDLDPANFPWHIPYTLGHENAGWVHALGDGVTGWEIGQPVAVYGPWGCGRCARCAIGMENYCEDPASAPAPGGGGGLGLDGGMARLLRVPAARHLVALPDGLTPRQAAPLTDAGLTTYHAIARSRDRLTATSTAVVIGVGGLGHMAVQLLGATTAARVVAVDAKPAARQLATQLGASLAIEPGPDAATEIRAFAHGRGADVVLDLVGSSETMALAVASARTLGDVTVVGIAGGTAAFGFFSVPYEVSLQTTYWGSRPELVEVLELAARGVVGAHAEVFGLHEAPEVYRRLCAGEIIGRAVIDPSVR